jgi:hypothetical protein
MSKSAVSAPVSSAASDRLALGVGLMRPGAGSVSGTVNPSSTFTPGYCFEGNDE